MINTNKLKGKITEKGATIKQIAQEMRLTPATLGKKISNKAPTTLDEVDTLQALLGINDSEFIDYFLQR